MDARHNTRALRLLAANQRARHLPCWLCGRPINYTLRTPDPGSFSYDHVIPVSIRPDLTYDPGNGASSHLLCNQRRGDGAPTAALRIERRDATLGDPSQRW